MIQLFWKLYKMLRFAYAKTKKISGAATFGLAINHFVPVKYREENVFAGVSHLTVDFFEVLQIGINGVRKKVENSMKKHNDPKKLRFLKSCLNTIDGMKIWHERYLEELRNTVSYEANLKNLENVPFKPATNFYEAVQSIWFSFAFLRLLGN